MKHAVIVAALLFAGCGKKSEPSGPSCADAVDKAINSMPGGPGGGGADIKDKLRAIYTKHCTDDKWNADAIKCFATDAHDMPSMKACRAKLTADQQEKVMGEVRTVMMGAMGGAGPMHGAAAPPAGDTPPAGAGPAGGGPTPTGSPAPAGSAAP
ncbi:MAG TPA: hypothetical protein VMZ53_18195 [Kofleriaceae bacterium]|nr:hypothetical protein [Kofleriaceae bacterium]